MKLLPFKDLIKLSKEKLDEALALPRAIRAKANAKLEMSKIEVDILNRESKIQEMCVSNDINFNRLIDEIDEIELLERRQRKFAEVLEQLFPDEKSAPEKAA
jgi:hypothetical protein